jgi:hypothetical protein
VPVGLTTGIKAGIRTGIKTGITGGTYVSGAAADSDATSGKYVPSTAAQFTALGISAPVSIHLCQEASGSLADSVGSLTLAATNAPSYQQAVTGWTRRAVGFTAGTANQRFSAGAGVGPNPSTTSVMWLVYAAVIGAQGGNRDMFGPNITGSNACKVQSTTTPRVRNLINGVTGTGTSDPTATGLQPMVLKYDRTGGAATLYTGQEKIAGTYSAGVTDGTAKGLGSSGGTVFGGLIAYSAVWSGANAEINDAQAKALLQALGWTIPWS